MAKEFKNFEAIKKSSEEFFVSQNLSALALGLIDFNRNEFKSFALGAPENVHFDLASLSKPLTNSVGAMAAPERLGPEMELLLNHEAGLPSWGLLPKTGWKDIISKYPISKSSTLYSDYSALRFMLEFNKGKGPSLHEVASKFWDEEVVFWKDLPMSALTVQNGTVNGGPNFRRVHDPNAATINDLVSHAGLFGSVRGVCKTLLNLDRELNLLSTMRELLSSPHGRFVKGWDTVADSGNTLAGNGASEHVFGHLGFTGTSIWIDSECKFGYTLLTNATKDYWYAKSELNQFRKNLGEFIWQSKAS